MISLVISRFLMTNSRFRLADFLISRFLKRAAREYNAPPTCVTRDAEVDRACGYKRGVAGPNEIDQNGGQIQTSNLAALDPTNALTSAYNGPFMATTRVAVID